MDAAPEITDAASAGTVLSGAGPDVFTNANTITRWLMSQQSEARVQIAQGIFDKLLQDASQSRQHHGNGQACVKLCSFVQQCAKSSDSALKQWAFTELLSRRLFHFYLEWYEHDPHRALRLVLDVLVLSSTSNPSPDIGRLVNEHVLETLVSIVARKSPRLLTKSGLQCLDHFLTKQAIALDDIARKYREIEPLLAESDTLSLWKSFIFHLFSWMELPYVGPLAGKCSVHIFRALRNTTSSCPGLDSPGFTAELWLAWLQDGLTRNHEILEDIKNYVLVPIFKTDKIAALDLLRAFNRIEPLTAVGQELSDETFLLRLATLELGKKSGLVEEPSREDDVLQPTTYIALRETVLDSFLSHPSIYVRSSAFSLLVSSQATTKPFSNTAFALLKRHLAPFHADYDAKFRNEVLGLSKNLLRRAKNVITVAQRTLARPSNENGQQPADGDADAARLATKKKFGPEATLGDDVEAKEILVSHQEFIEWYLNFLKGEILPTTSYQRHITALKAALLALRIGKHAGAADELDIDIAQTISSDLTWIRLLLDLILDPFDDVREAAATVLGLFPPSVVEGPADLGPAPATLLQILQEFSLRARDLANRTGRADHGDGAARSQGLLCKWLNKQELRTAFASRVIQELEDKISKAENDLGHAAIENPVHGDFAAMNYVWHVLAPETYVHEQLEVLHQIHYRVFACSKRIWAAVKHVLCDDSPEGHLPEEMEEIDGLDTKDLLSYSFRAVHESSNLLRSMIGTLRLEPAPGVPFPSLDIFKEIGYLAFEQLATLRHRGAFSTVSLTFTTCCQLTQRLERVFADVAVSSELLCDWYQARLPTQALLQAHHVDFIQGALLCIESQASTTRRSAGIPSLVAAILSADAPSPPFEEVFHTLGEIAKKHACLTETDGSNLPQVHALNCLREVFRSSLLSKKAESYLAVSLHLAANSLKSEIWAIRNCGLLLLRSLIDCLLGTGESKATMESGWDGHSVRISYGKYPTLPGVILGLLQSADEVLDEVSPAAAEAVFPALDIIRRAGPPEEHREELRGYIQGYLGSKIWHVREIAARTLCSFLLPVDWVAEIDRLLGERQLDANRLHGILLAMKFVIERKVDLGRDADSNSVALNSLLNDISRTVKPLANHPEIQAAYLEIINLLASITCREMSTKPGVREPITSTGEAAASMIRGTKPSALLDIEVTVKLFSDLAVAGNLRGLRLFLFQTLSRDINTATRMLETLPKTWEARQGTNARSELCLLYADICIHTAAPEARAQALTNLGLLMDDILNQNELAELPGIESLDQLWAGLQNGEINPTLSYAIIRTSGTIMAVLTSRHATHLNQRLRGWGVMIADALDVDNMFDTRYAAARALKSFFVGCQEHSWDTKYLPALSALYDGLIDDDDEVREVAASAAAGVIGTYLVPPVAADRLVGWVRRQFEDQKEFHQLLVCRMTGQTPRLDTGDFHLISAEKQLVKAMDYDESLFATEEQNLFIDEIKETIRWQEAFRHLGHANEDGPFGCLTKWTEAGLRCLTRIAEMEDGPLGWTSDQHVFSICARVILCAVAMTKTGKSAAVVELLGEFKSVGRRAMLHGSLLGMAA
ncbi:putative death-receptor fusion protein-domain-containing protein [Lasiosphaeris hirsuta]|uniref:Death-receptor fusion protein-domain-containing protein n=1 Tax=Lasiosphaeris hirsuta TaxID=260670 RepID=A0AA40DPY7_9PEZI|nr:putative death-receptor fusion protein-domain-containing protein [Lasiosphaeris hirsuta]